VRIWPLLSCSRHFLPFTTTHFFFNTDFNIILHLRLRPLYDLSSFQVYWLYFCMHLLFLLCVIGIPPITPFLTLSSKWHATICTTHDTPVFPHPPPTSSAPSVPSSQPLRSWQIPQLPYQVTASHSSLICKEMSCHYYTCTCVHLPFSSRAYLMQNFAFWGSSSSCIKAVLTFRGNLKMVIG
jgi:hypothetical protein